MSPPDLNSILDLKRSVWEALARGDSAADASLLHKSFLGVYPSGFAGHGEHVGQLTAGPTVLSFEIQDARLLVLNEDLALLAYLAVFRRPGAKPEAPSERMYVSSLWQCYPEGWLNVYSQDTPAA